ncbi:TetR/AcrR family transcriptional regulator [Rhodococcus sp. B50]|uniref:TetR/AcrR family transcriptional regulator n=1 Tax=Rhodococcus sp. B50 TaxID=2682847 RepID=UPI001BD28206|nr:TetR/AcrR family transcriptional regulator [Rhodococcus sp. B50]MBS9376496.1 HTH-type transcriptional repressor KstR2 [Rhodococcus sp. B50]
MSQHTGKADIAEGVVIDDWRYYDPAYTLPELLDAALELFVTCGYYGTSVRAIASRAGMTVPGLYYNFKNKQDMLVTLLRMSNDELRRRGQAALADAGDDPRNRFIALVENTVLYMTNRRRLAHLAREIRGLEEPYRSQHIALRDEFEAMMLTEVISARALGLFDTPDPHEATRAVLVLCQGVADWYRPGGTKTPQDIADRYIQFALALVGDIRP